MGVGTSRDIQGQSLPLLTFQICFLNKLQPTAEHLLLTV